MLAGQWLDVPGYDGKYQANFEGDIRRVYAKSGRTRLITPYKKKRRPQRVVVQLTKNGKSKEVAVMSVIARTFLGPCPPGCVPYHRNGMQKDNCAGNIAYIKKSELGKLTGASANRKPVVKLNPSGQPIAYYSSARDAARQNYMSRQTIADRCNGKVKHGPAPDGCEYAWDDDTCSIRWAIRRMELSKEYVPPMPEAPTAELDF